MSDLPPPETAPAAPQPDPEIFPPATPQEAPATAPTPDDGRPYDL